VHERLYNSRITKELNFRKLASKLIEEEAKDYTYMPRTNNVVKATNMASSDGSLTHRERKIEGARKEFEDGNLCVDCFKQIEISTGSFNLATLVCIYA
jgi:hypothetical protein